MRWRTPFLATLVVALVAASAGPAGAVGAAPRLGCLDPGGQPRLAEKVPVNVVFLGYTPAQADKNKFLAGLAEKYEPVVRSRLSYGVTEKLGISYTYDYRLTYTNKAYQDTFFKQLGKLATPAPLTAYQQECNDQAKNVLDITGNNTIDAPGGTTADDEETGLGATRRVWFHDLSAGPESWTSNYDVDNADGDGVPGYRMPPTWEYVKGGFRDPAALAGDLSKLTRYVALNLLMTTSPLYPVELTGGTLPKSINLDSNTYEGWPGVDASAQYIKPDLVTEELSELRWRNRLSEDQQDLPYTAENQACYVAELNDESCYPELGLPAFANLYLYTREHLDGVLDGNADYEVPVFNYAVGPGVGVRAPVRRSHLARSAACSNRGADGADHPACGGGSGAAGRGGSGHAGRGAAARGTDRVRHRLGRRGHPCRGRRRRPRRTCGPGARGAGHRRAGPGPGGTRRVRAGAGERREVRLRLGRAGRRWHRRTGPVGCRLRLAGPARRAARARRAGVRRLAGRDR
ncbi:hypothetical protein [Actinoplanes awajinensis]|uniref:hypothetical protein n=1 Tax=Actinoplanes awajinensis TaxID=135946 RepID=UPI0030845DC8